jgi:hypothetical protein
MGQAMLNAKTLHEMWKKPYAITQNLLTVKKRKQLHEIAHKSA